MIVRTERAAHLSESHPLGLCFSWYRIPTGERGWESAYRFPRIGVSAFWVDYRTRLFGHGFALLPNMKFELLRYKHSTLHFKIGTGVGYITNPFDLQTNFRQTQVSSRLNASMFFGLSFQQKINPQWQIRSGVDLVHFSNAAFSLPNAGNNMFNANFGLIYTPFASQIVLKDSLRPFQKEWRLCVGILNGWIEQEENENRKHYTFTANALLTWQCTRKSQWQIGIEFNVNNGIKAYLNRTMIDENRSPLPQPDFRRVAWIVGHELLAGKIALVKQIGIYLYKPYEGDSPNMPIYQRLGIKYYFNHRITGQFSMKTHLGSAETLEFGVGYRFLKPKN
ncbi:MAG: acyloxyacyl hydrolase [Microscillaceae bacterium]|nr:acyloxyacyl hydrolase [Microscillaceae bacterium]MDW8460436.1 acyloxyacyl hydrolase [Cytophagales bacterium]